MSVDIWPSRSPEEINAALDQTQSRELAWQIRALGNDLRSLKMSLDDCYHLLGPSGRGNTLVVSTPRHETVKGHITRLGTRIVKGTLHLKLRTLPPQTLTIDPAHPITIGPLHELNTLLTRSLDLLDLTVAHAYPAASAPAKGGAAAAPAPAPAARPSSPGRPEAFLAAQLRVLSQALQDAAALMRGPPRNAATDPLWTTQSAVPAHFAPTPAPPAPGLSVYFGLQDSQLVLWLRALEPADAPVHLGMKVALALGTARRLEHDEADQVFSYCCEDGRAHGLPGGGAPASAAASASASAAAAAAADGARDGPADVYVREKIRVESADPSLLSLSAKLSALSHTLLSVRRNLAAVMGEDMDD